MQPTRLTCERVRTRTDDGHSPATGRAMYQTGCRAAVAVRTGVSQRWPPSREEPRTASERGSSPSRSWGGVICSARPTAHCEADRKAGPCVQGDRSHSREALASPISRELPETRSESRGSRSCSRSRSWRGVCKFKRGWFVFIVWTNEHAGERLCRHVPGWLTPAVTRGAGPRSSRTAARKGPACRAGETCCPWAGQTTGR